MTKALATDLYGTLLRYHKVPSYNQDAIKDLKEDFQQVDLITE
ncbi:MAG: hypothetical protein ACRC3Y_13570 [Romboutsia sp.]